MNQIMNKISRSELFHNIRKKQPYFTKLFDIELCIAEDVFPPDFGATTIHLANAIKHYSHVNTALDMGCGTGFLALFMRKCGIPIVWAVDIHEKAIKCTIENIHLNSYLAPIHTIASDLFSSIPSDNKFDLIAFNHPYYPTVGEPVFGYNPDGGEEILNRFFTSLKQFCHADTKILLPFSSMTESEHDPAVVASRLQKFNIQTLSTIHDANGCHKIYEITFKEE